MDKNIKYGRIYQEIARGYSKDYINKTPVYFKHPSLTEHFFIYSGYEIIIENVRQRGLLTEAEKLKEAIANNWWTQDKEEKFFFLKKTIENLTKTKNKLLLGSQKQELEERIQKTEAIFFTYVKDRKDIIGYTAEHYAQEKFFDELIVSFTYRDENLNIKYFCNEEDFYNITDEENSKLRSLYTKYSSCFSTETIKLVAANGFFQNLIYLDTVPQTFWGQPLVQCSKYQIDLLVYGKMFKSTIDAHIKNDKPIADDIINDPENFVQWFDSLNSSKPSGKFKNRASDKKNAVSSYVGATKEDLDKLGVKVEKLKGKSLLELAQEKGGTLEKSDYFKARENS